MAAVSIHSSPTPIQMSILQSAKFGNAEPNCLVTVYGASSGQFVQPEIMFSKAGWHFVNAHYAGKEKVPT